MSRRILLVEDDPSVLFITAQILSRLGKDINVIPVSGGEQAISLLNQEKIDLLITDLRMEPLSGQELTQIALKKNPDLRVVWISAYNSDWVRSEAKKLGVDYVFSKPVEAETIRKVVLDILYPADCVNNFVQVF